MVTEIHLRCRFCPRVIVVSRQAGETCMGAMYAHLHRKHAIAWRRLCRSGARRTYLLTTGAREQLRICRAEEDAQESEDEHSFD